jgi:hypothetical protein
MLNLVFVTKPVQYVNARNAVQTINCGRSILVIVDQFFGALEFYSRIKKFDKTWDLIIFSSSRTKALFQLKFKLNVGKIDNILSNSDISKDPLLYKIFYPTASQILYEEGWGNYIPDALFDQSSIKNLIYILLCLNKQYGFSRFTDKVYLYYRKHQCLNIKHKSSGFKNDFLPYLKLNHYVLSKVFDTINVGDVNDIAFILPSKIWSVNFDLLQLSDYKKIYLKPHPHTMSYDAQVAKKYGAEILGNNVFIELFIAFNENKNITIYHDDSMIGLYARNRNVKIINVNKKPSIIKSFLSKVK